MLRQSRRFPQPVNLMSGHTQVLVSYNVKGPTAILNDTLNLITLLTTMPLFVIFYNIHVFTCHNGEVNI